MQKTPLGESKLSSSRLAYGCWRLAPASDVRTNLETARAAVLAAVEAGFTLFDHADVYCHTRAESAFGEVLRENPKLRKKLLVATKCGIRHADEPPGAPHRYDFSADPRAELFIWTDPGRKYFREVSFRVVAAANARMDTAQARISPAFAAAAALAEPHIAAFRQR